MASEHLKKKMVKATPHDPSGPLLRKILKELKEISKLNGNITKFVTKIVDA